MICLLALALCSLNLVAGSLPSKDEKAVLAAMEAWRQAMISRDKAGLETLYAPELSYFHSNGKLETKAQAIEAVVNGKNRFESIELTDIAVRLYGKTALVTGKIGMRINSDGKVSPLTLDVLHVWVKTSKGWQMVARHATRLNP
jgi:ketosteroid isomerase-like protein